MSLLLDGRWIGVLRTCELAHIFLLLVIAVVAVLQARAFFAGLMLVTAFANVLFLRDLQERKIRVLYIRRFAYKKSWAYVWKCAMLSTAPSDTSCIIPLMLYEMVIVAGLLLRRGLRVVKGKTRSRILYRKYSRTAIPEEAEED
jgi:hypothetical protein